MRGRFVEVSGEKRIRVALDATAIGRGKTGNETYLTGLLEGWGEAKPGGVELLPIFTQTASQRDFPLGACISRGGFFPEAFGRFAESMQRVEGGSLSRGVLDATMGEEAVCADRA